MTNHSPIVRFYNRFAKTPHFSADDEGKARFQASPKISSKAVESLPEKTLGFQLREAYRFLFYDQRGEW